MTINNFKHLLMIIDPATNDALEEVQFIRPMAINCHSNKFKLALSQTYLIIRTYFQMKNYKLHSDSEKGIQIATIYFNCKNLTHRYVGVEIMKIYNFRKYQVPLGVLLGIMYMIYLNKFFK